MGEHLERARQIAHNAAATTDVWIKLVTLQGLIHDIETLQLALAEEMHRNQPVKTLGEVVDRQKPKLVRSDEEKPT